MSEYNVLFEPKNHFRIFNYIFKPEITSDSENLFKPEIISELKLYFKLKFI